jgi:hypothetical protein
LSHPKKVFRFWILQPHIFACFVLFIFSMRISKHSAHWCVYPVLFFFKKKKVPERIEWPKIRSWWGGGVFFRHKIWWIISRYPLKFQRALY